MKMLSMLKRFALAELSAIAFSLLLEALAYAGTSLVRVFYPHAGDGYLVNIGFFWELMAFSCVAVAIVAGGPCYVLCARFMWSKSGPAWVTGFVIALGSAIFFACNLNASLSGGCGGG